MVNVEILKMPTIKCLHNIYIPLLSLLLLVLGTELTILEPISLGPSLSDNLLNPSLWKSQGKVTVFLTCSGLWLGQGMYSDLVCVIYKDHFPPVLYVLTNVTFSGAM